MPIQDEQGRRLALIVASSDYRDPALQQLRAPGHDARELASVLADPAIGVFDVRTFINTPSGQLLRGIAEFCHQADPGDLLLVYLSCHGVLDDRGRLYYATIDTERALLAATAVAAHWLSEQLDDCRARRQIMLLDCCHSGAFAKGSKGDSALKLKDRFSGRGKIVLTASRATEYSFEGATVVGEGIRSVFTRAVVDGLRTGEADRDRDGLVTINDLYRHVYDTVRATESRQTPELWAFGAEGDLLVAHSPRGPIIEPIPLPEDLRLTLENSRMVVRESGVKVLADILDHGEPGLVMTARLMLQRISEEDHPRIAALARAAHDAGHGQAVTQLEAQERARREAEEQARREAEERARREAEERARREAEERARREAEERAQREAEERAQREAEERAQREAEERAQREAERVAAQHRQQVEQLQRRVREHAAAHDWDAVLAANDQLTKLDPAAADPDLLASTAREQISRREAEQAKTEAPQPADDQDRTSPPAPEPVAAATTPARPSRRPLVIAGAVTAVASLVLAIVLVHLGGSSARTRSSGQTTGTLAGFQALNPGTGPPQRGGTLNMLGSSDVDVMDYNVSYYSVGSLAQRPWLRGLYAYPALPGKTTEPSPDLATAAPTVSADGLTYSVTIRNGAMWNTSPPRQVTAADAVRGLKRSCNSAFMFGGIIDFESLIAGYQAFCNGFAAVAHTASAIKAYIDGQQISGVTASGQTITFKLVHPASYFASLLTLNAFNPAPVESLRYVPDSASAQQHLIADGPYMVQSYTPAHRIVYVRNPAWQASSDPIRKAYVNKIVVTETGNATSIQQQLRADTAAAGMGFDTLPPVSAYTGLIAQMNAGGRNFNLGPTYSTDPYIVFNTASPNNGGALAKVAVRQALSYGINRSHLIKDNGGPQAATPLTHILPPGVTGSEQVPANYDPYPYNPSKAKSMLASAGLPNGLTLKLLYRSSSTIQTSMFETLQADLTKIGVKVTGIPTTDIYTKYLLVPKATKQGSWDIALTGWFPDWYPDSALSFFKPMFGGQASYPPYGENFGFYNNSTVNKMIAQSARQASVSAAASLWGELDQKIMQDAPIYPITDPKLPLYHASFVHNAVYVPVIEQFDPTNVWLSTP